MNTHEFGRLLTRILVRPFSLQSAIIFVATNFGESRSHTLGHQPHCSAHKSQCRMVKVTSLIQATAASVLPSWPERIEAFPR